MPILIIEAIAAIVEGAEGLGTAITLTTVFAGTGLLVEEFGEDIKGLILGVVLGQANINSKSNSKTYEGSGVSEFDVMMKVINTIMTIAQVISVAQLVVDSAQELNMQSSTNVQSFEATEQGGTIIDGIPVYEHEPWVESFPDHVPTAPQIESFPATPNEAPTTTVFPDTKPQIPSVETFPAETPKVLDDIIRMAYNNLPNHGVWPKGNPARGEIGKFKDKLDELFGQEGIYEDDGPYTKGRKQVKWVFPNGTEVVWERHPYDKKNGAPSTHTEAHYHVNQNGHHGPGFKGTD